MMNVLKAAGFYLLFLSLSLPVLSAEEARDPHELFPMAKPFFMGRLEVSDLHTISYMLFGNPEGRPVFVLHGGPGFGCYPRLMQYFNPEKFFIILHDQRGSGQSVPLGETKENTTQHLVEDIEKLRKRISESHGLKGKIMIFGGSWGTTLGLAYAETYPENVSCMVLRGVYTGTQAEIDNVWAGTTSRQFFPKARAEFESALPEGFGRVTPAYLQKIFTSDDREQIEKVLAAWARFGMKIGRLHTPDEYLDQPFGGMDMLPCALIDAHYMANNCFLEEGQLLNNADRLKDIPTTFINGRYDMICNPIIAYQLHERMPKSKLIIVEEAGHSEGEEGTTKVLLEAVAEFE